MEKILIIEKSKGMEREGAIELLKNHQGLRHTKIQRLRRQLAQTVVEYDAIYNEISRREKEEEGV